MAKVISFTFGTNRKSKSKKPKKTNTGKHQGTGTKSNAWRAYVSNAPIPD